MNGHEDVGKLEELSHTSGRNGRWKITLENWQFLIKLHTHLLHNPAMTPQGIYPSKHTYEDLFTNVHTSFLHKAANRKLLKCSPIGDSVDYSIFNKILPHSKKKGTH